MLGAKELPSHAKPNFEIAERRGEEITKNFYFPGKMTQLVLEPWPNMQFDL